MKEIWKDIIGFEGIYEISNLGRIRRIKTGRILSTRRSDGWYITVTLYKDKKKYGKLLHRLVAETFVPNPYNLPEVNHIDEDKINNRADNLEFCDHKYNMNFGTARIRERDTKIKNGHINEEYSGLDKKSYGKKYYQDHKEEIKEYNKKYREEHKEELKEKSKKYYQDCKEEIKEYNKEYNKKYREEHKEEIREKKRAYYIKHKEEIKEKSNKYREDHKEDKNEYGKKYYQDCKEEMKKYKETHKEEIKEYGKKYREEHKEYFKKYREEHKEELKEKRKKYYQEHKVKK